MEKHMNNYLAFCWLCGSPLGTYFLHHHLQSTDTVLFTVGALVVTGAMIFALKLAEYQANNVKESLS